MFSGVRLNYLQERVLYGCEAASAIRDEAQRVGANRVFIVTARHVPAQDFAAGIAMALGNRHVGTYAGVSGHGPKEQVVQAANEARRVRADLLVSIGGGSVTDAAKVMLRCIWEEIDRPENLQPNRTFGAHVVPGLDPTIYPPGCDERIRLVAVPATFACTEFNFGGSVMNTTLNCKEAHAHPLMIPRSVVLDPEVTKITPLEILLSTGVKVLATCVARYCNPANNVATEVMAREAISRMPVALRAIKSNPGNNDARLLAQLSAWWTRDADFHGIYGSAGSAITQVLAGYGVPDGVAGSIAMPAAFCWNRSFDTARQAEVSEIMGEPKADLGTIFDGIRRELGLAGRLRDVGVSRRDFHEIAKRSLGNQQIKGNPRPVKGTEDLLEILELAW